jgi:ribonucleoside-diphosphate reductase alpha chain
VPFLKVVNDTAVAVNQGGKRKGAVCAYLETWHMDIEEFLELRKNTGDDRRRTHDMNTANWIPDLFMKRVFDDGDWTLFSPNDVPDLHDLYRQGLRERYTRVRRWPRAASSSCTRPSRPPTCGARCWACCSRPAIPG